MTPGFCQQSGKIMFPSARDARAYLKQWRTRKAKREQLPQYAYRCEHCHQWHLTRVPPEQIRRTQRRRMA